MYLFEQVSAEEAGKFAKENGIFSQTENWAHFRTLFRPSAFLGKDESGKIVLSCILFRLPIYGTPWSIGYATRGFVCDFTNEQLVTEFTAYLKAFMKRKHVIYAIIDPWCDYKIDFQDPQYDVCALLTRLGYERTEGRIMQPATNYRLHIDASRDIEEERKRIFGGFAVKLQNDIRISAERGVTVEKSTKENLDEFVSIFYRLLLETDAKKGFGHRNLEYYQKFARSLSDYVTIYLYKYNSKVDIAYTEKVLQEVRDQIQRYDDEIADPQTTDKKRERLAPKRKEAVKQLEATEKRLQVSKQLTDDPYISASFYIKMGNKAYNFYGANAKALRDLRLTANYWDMIRDSIDGNVTTFNMGGTLKLNTEDIKKDSMYDLYLYKKQYGGEFVQMPGEFFLIRDRKKYEFFHKKLNYFRRMVYHF